MNEQNIKGTGLEQFSAIWRRRRVMILSVFAIVAVPSICAVLALPDVYEAEATVIPTKVAMEQSSGSEHALTPLDTVSEQVLSRARLAALIKKYGLYPHAKHGPESATAAMRKDISIQPQEARQNRGGAPYAFNVIYRGGDAQKVAAVANSLAVSYETVAREIQTQAFTSAAVKLKGRLSIVRKKLDNQQRQINRYSAEHKGEMPDQQDSNLAAMRRLDSRLRDNDGRQLRLMESRAELLQNMGESGQSALPQLEQRLSELKLQYTDKYPEVIALKERIAKLKASQAGSAGKAISQTPQEQQLQEINSTLAALQREENKLRSQINTYQQHLDDAPMTAQRLKTLTQGYAETSDLYATLLKGYEQVRLTQATSGQGGPQYQVLESAMVPIGPSGPGRLKLLLVCLILGVGLSAIAAVVAEQFDTSFHSLEELQAFTSLPVLSTVPLISTPGDIRKSRLRLGVAVVSVIAVVGILGAGASLYAQGNQVLAQKFSHHIGSGNS